MKYNSKEEKLKNPVGYATKKFAIHMGIIMIGCILVGIFWSKTTMWLLGGSLSFLMIGWHVNNIANALDKDRQDNRRCNERD